VRTSVFSPMSGRLVTVVAYEVALLTHTHPSCCVQLPQSL
jgi:hypothetical protein